MVPSFMIEFCAGIARDVGRVAHACACDTPSALLLTRVQHGTLLRYCLAQRFADCPSSRVASAFRDSALLPLARERQAQESHTPCSETNASTYGSGPSSTACNASTAPSRTARVTNTRFLPIESAPYPDTQRRASSQHEFHSGDQQHERENVVQGAGRSAPTAEGRADQATDDSAHGERPKGQRRSPPVMHQARNAGD